jgi:formate C-acetyltransferase
LILTRIFQQSEGQPHTARWTQALDAILREMTIYIGEDELIVGNQASFPMAAPLFPEASVDWLQDDLDRLETRSQDPFQINTKTKKELLQIIPYWQTRSMEAAYRASRPLSIARSEQAKAIRIKSSGGIGHQLLNLDFVLSKGMRGIDKIIQEKIDSNNGKGSDNQKILFWDALRKTCASFIAFSGRYSKLAQSKAVLETDIDRKNELNRIATVCANVPTKPAQSFHEALQCTWFMTLIGHIFQSGGGVTLGRLDQILFPYLERDLEDERLTIKQAQELLDCFWLKLQELNVVRSSEIVTAWAGYEVNPTVNIGGQKEPGEDATNPLTFMCLTAEEHIHMRNPQLIMRIHEGTPKELWHSAVRVIRLGGGKPSLISDKVCMAALERLGVPKDRVHRYSVIGCAEPTEGDHRIMIRWSWLCLPKILELALNDGVDPNSKLRVGLSTGSAEEFESIEDLLEAFRLQLNHQVDLICTAVNEYADPLVGQMMPHYAFSAITPSCIEKGRDISDGGAEHTWSVIWPIGPATTINAISAIDSIICSDGDFDWTELILALDTDFQHAEGLRQNLLQAPKFGNDNEAVDTLANRIINMTYDAIERHKNIFGGSYTTGFITLGANVHYGKFVHATPDGRKTGTPLSDGMSPSQGTEFEGPTATMLSVSKLDLHRAGSGGILNLKFNPSILESPSDIEKFIQLNETYLIDLGGLQVQYNIVSADTLRDAQLHPDKYGDLLVRVVGYCARFIDLSPEVQADLIARTEHGYGNYPQSIR